ncbi:MAG: hypothetical protein ACYS80_25570, partial [Planctomycetota bacterium]
MNDVDPVQLTECLDIAPVIPEEDDLVKSLHIAAILDVIHLDFNARSATASRGCVDIANHSARVEIERVGLEELYQRHRLPDRPEDLRRNAQVRLGVAANNVRCVLLRTIEPVNPRAADAMGRDQHVL